MAENQFLEIIKGLVENAQRKAPGALNTLKQVGESAVDYSPIGILNKLLVNQSMQPAREDLQASMSGTKTEKFANQQLGPGAMQSIMKEEGDKVFRKFIKSSAEQVLSQPGGAEILAQSIYQQEPPMSMLGQESDQTQSSLLNTTQKTSNQLKPESQKSEPGLLRRVLAGALEGFASNAAPNLETQRLQKQERLGKKPLQEGEREKIGLEFDKELEKIANTQPDALNVEQASKFGLMINGQKSLGIAAEMIAKNPGVISGSKLPGFLKTQEGRQLITHMETAYEGQLRATSGATLGEKEIQRKVKQYGQGLTDNPGTLNTKLKSLNNWYNYSINTADPSGVHRQRALGQQNNSGTLEAIRAEKERRGLK